MKKYIILVFLIQTVTIVKAQSTINFGDSIRLAYKIPELAFAVLSSDSIFELHTIGVQRINTNFKANPNDRFHIGSNTKAITAFIAALLVEKGKIKWDTKFLDLFPALKLKSKKVYHTITLENLLTFRGKLPKYTYTFEKPTLKEITGDNANQRLLLAKYFLSQNPMKEENGLTASNADYILAGLMLEKATGKSYKELVTDFGKTLNIDFGFDYPNLLDTLQLWGHDVDLKPLPPFDNYKLNWLLSAGNINVSLPDYVKFIQLQLQGLKGNSTLLSKNEFDKLLFGLPIFSFGWFNENDKGTNHTIAYNEGNAGAFITQVKIIKQADRAYIFFTNSATVETKKGIIILQDYLQKKYGE
ncbi:MAG: serine hydrolase [Ferruginibacter sp.]